MVIAHGKKKLNREYNKAEIIKEAENRKLSLVECIYISDSLRLFDIHKVKLKILNLNNNSYEIVDEEIIKNINAKYEEIDKKYKYDLPNGYIAKLNLDKKNVCKKNNSKLYAGSYLRKDGKEILLKACIYKNKISIININLKNFKEIEYDLRNFAPKENKFWKIINILRYELGPTKFRLKLDGILQEEEILISKFILSGHEEFKTLKDYYNNLAKSLGCNIKKVNLDDCVKRYLSFFLGTGPMTMEEVDEIKKDKLVMGEIVKAIEEMHRANNQSQQEPTEEEKAFAQAQEQGLINSQNFYKMYDPILEKHLNSRGWTQVNPKLEKILNSMGRSQVPVKHQKRFTIRAGNLNYNF